MNQIRELFPSFVAALNFFDAWAKRRGRIRGGGYEAEERGEVVSASSCGPAPLGAVSLPDLLLSPPFNPR